jgi:hypothetical protein
VFCLVSCYWPKSNVGQAIQENVKNTATLSCLGYVLVIEGAKTFKNEYGTCFSG